MTMPADGGRRSTSRPRACWRSWRARSARAASRCSSGWRRTGSRSRSCGPPSQEGRLAVLPVERLLAGEPRYSIAGGRRAGGRARGGAGAPAAGARHRLRRGRRRRASSAPRTSSRRTGRGRCSTPGSARTRSPSSAGRSPSRCRSSPPPRGRSWPRAFATPERHRGTTISDRIAEQAQALLPLVGPTLEYVYRLHLREQLRHAAFAADDVRDRATPAAETVTVAFADLVGFTELGEALPPEELGRSPGGSTSSPARSRRGPVRLVKLIGDAAMLASPDTDALRRARRSS